MKERRPAMTIAIEQEYFNNNLSEHIGFTDVSGVFTKTILEDELNLEITDESKYNFFQSGIPK